MCQNILEASIGKFDNVNDLSPTDDACAIQMLNRSKNAALVVEEIKEALNKTKPTTIEYPELIPCFFAALPKVRNDVQRSLCLKQLQGMVNEHETNLDLFMSDHEFPNLVHMIFTYLNSFTQQT